MKDLDLGVIGNCAVAALIDRDARVVWYCLPRFDGDPVFHTLLGAPKDAPDDGVFAIELEAYIDIRHELEALSGKINGKFGDFDWTPLRYVHRSVARETLAVHYRASRIGLVTPLRDGMNLVAMEFIAAQDAADPGVLILSRFAGAAAELQEALIVNPYDIDKVAHARRRAIEMPKKEPSNAIAR
jgi:trehalose-6-phosphate synthase